MVIRISYDSGAGNGPFGFGWNLSLPAISRKTDKGLPRYFDAEDSDVFLLSGVEDLMLILALTANLSRASKDIEDAIKVADKIHLAQNTAAEIKETAMPNSPGKAVLDDPETKKSYLYSMLQYYKYRSEGYIYRSRVFELQLLSSRMIFVTVLMLVLSACTSLQYNFD